ncbi:MAG: DUF928 domain-containing protein [Cyanobacteriota bacterium]|nr:DUF928 domain-containing protein [Cyanobacteriota bacterium]
MNPIFSAKLLGVTVVGLLALGDRAVWASVPSATQLERAAIALDFQLPSGSTPKTSIGGGVRGSVQFSLPNGGRPRSSIGGGVRGNTQFSLPNGGAPRSSIGGGVRGNTQFSLPNGGRPRSSIGGGVRGDTQFALPSGGAPRSSIGGGVRGDTQFSLPSGGAPRSSVGGGVRGDAQFALPGGGAPRSSVGGGVRGEEIPQLTALVPPTQQGNTISARPTIFAYLPPIGAQEVFFSLQDEEGNSFYHATLSVPAQGGAIAVSLPPDAPELEIGKNYLWYFAPLAPEGILRPDNYAVVGWVTRVEAAADLQASSLSPVELATEYARQGLWYDTLKVLADARQSQPENSTLATEWEDLLKQVGLEAIATQPLAIANSKQ